MERRARFSFYPMGAIGCYKCGCEPSPNVRSCRRSRSTISEKEIVEQEIFELELPDRTLLSGASSRMRDLSDVVPGGQGFAGRLPGAAFRRAVRDDFRLREDEAGEPLLRDGAENGRGLREARLHRGHRRRPGHHAGGKPRRVRSGRPLAGGEYRAALRAGDQPLRPAAR